MVGEINTVIQCEKQVWGERARRGSCDLCWALPPRSPFRGGSPREGCGIAQGAPMSLGCIRLGLYLQISPAILNELFTTVPFRSKLFGTSFVIFLACSASRDNESPSATYSPYYILYCLKILLSFEDLALFSSPVLGCV